MTTHDDLEEHIVQRKEAEKKNPLLKLNLGELVQEMNRICISDPNVIKPVEEIPKESLRNYKKYEKVVGELNRREAEYNSYKNPPSC